MIPGLILAAGASTRMGRPKALLPCDDAGTTFVSASMRSLLEGGVSEVVVIGRELDHALQHEVARVPGARFVVNPHPEDGQLSTLLVGLAAVERPDMLGVLVTPVDAPLITSSTIATLLSEFARAAPPIARAVHRGRHGHPVIFSRAVFGELRGADASVGARAVVRAHGADVLNVDVGDAGVLTDVDTPEEYRRIFGRAEGDEGLIPD